MPQPVEKPNKIWLWDDKDVIPSQRSAEADSANLEYCVMLDKRLTESAISDYDDNEEQDDMNFGALRPGGALNLLSFEALGLLSQYAGVGILMGVFSALQYPLYQNYLRMEGYQTASYTVLTSLGWSSKIFFGVLSDCFPIFGLQRRPYMVIGWTICAVCCLMMAITPFPEPYFGKPGLRLKPKETYTLDDRKYINEDAPTSGSFFIVLSMIASLGYVLADVAADAMVVQYAQREPAAIRGRVQTAIYFTRDTFSMIPMLLVGFCLNDFKYGGSFEWSIGPNIVYGVLTVPCIFAAYSAIALMVEERVERVPFRQYMRNAWHLLQQRVVWQICAFKFLNMLFFGYNSTLIDPVSSVLVRVAPIINTTFSIVYQLFRVTAMFTIGKFALDWDWRVTMATSTVLLVLIDTTRHLFATWFVLRNQYFHSIAYALEAIPAASIFLFSGYLHVEVAEIGNEGLVFALLTTCSNLATPLSTVIAKTFDSFLEARLTDIQQDDTSVRWQVSYSFIAAASFKLFSLVFLVLLPRQKAYVQVLKRTGSVSKTAAILVLLVFALGYTYNVTTNILSIFRKTSCLRIAGGKGC